MRALDIFCGGGLSSAGAQDAGVELAGGIDLCAIATSTYKSNFPNATVVNKRLEDIRLNRLRDAVGDIEVLLASPECTNHTCAKGAVPRSESSRATALQVLRFARAFEPRWIVMENVVHMRPWSRYRELIEALRSLNYYVSEQVLNAADFGVPQSRRRLFVICDRKALPPTIIAPKIRQLTTADSIIDKAGQWKTTTLRRKGRASDTVARADRAILALGTNNPFLLVYYGSDGSGGWQPLTRPLRTVTTVDRFALVTPTSHGHQMRMLQVPELKRAMGLRQDFQLPVGTRRDKIRLLGNGVCPPVMRRVLETLIQQR